MGWGTKEEGTLALLWRVGKPDSESCVRPVLWPFERKMLEQS